MFKYAKSMSLLGGIDMYSLGKRYGKEVSPKGRKVYFLNRNGYAMELEQARKLLKKDKS